MTLGIDILTGGDGILPASGAILDASPDILRPSRPGDQLYPGVGVFLSSDLFPGKGV